MLHFWWRIFWGIESSKEQQFETHMFKDFQWGNLSSRSGDHSYWPSQQCHMFPTIKHESLFILTLRLNKQSEAFVLYRTSVHFVFGELCLRESETSMFVHRTYCWLHSPALGRRTAGWYQVSWILPAESDVCNTRSAPALNTHIRSTWCQFA